MYLLRNSPLVYMNPEWMFVLAFGLLWGTEKIDYHRNFLLKHIMFISWIGIMGLSLVPLPQMYGLPAIYDAALASGVMVGSLATVAYNAPSKQFLSMGGPLALGLGGLLGTSILRMFNPTSLALWNINIWGGLGLFCLYVLHDTQKIIENAKNDKVFDPINNSIDMYLNFMNIALRILEA